MSRRSLSLAGLFAVATVPALFADEPAQLLEIYVLPGLLRPVPPEAAEPTSAPVMHREAVEAPRRTALVSYTPVAIQMEPVGAFDISCSLQIVPDSVAVARTLPAFESLPILVEPVVAPKPVPEVTAVPATGFDPSVFSCSSVPPAGFFGTPAIHQTQQAAVGEAGTTSP